MHYSTGIRDRGDFISALHDLASFLDSHPDVPVPLHGDQIRLCADSVDDGGKAQVDHIARLLGGTVTDDTANSGHYEAARNFGPLRYEVVSISDARMAEYNAERTYSGCVTPDTDPFAFTDCGHPGCTRRHPCGDCREASSRASVRRTQEAGWM